MKQLHLREYCYMLSCLDLHTHTVCGPLTMKFWSGHTDGYQVHNIQHIAMKSPWRNQSNITSPGQLNASRVEASRSLNSYKGQWMLKQLGCKKRPSIWSVPTEFESVSGSNINTQWVWFHSWAAACTPHVTIHVVKHKLDWSSWLTILFIYKSGFCRWQRT